MPASYYASFHAMKKTIMELTRLGGGVGERGLLRMSLALLPTSRLPNNPNFPAYFYFLQVIGYFHKINLISRDRKNR